MAPTDAREPSDSSAVPAAPDARGRFAAIDSTSLYCEWFRPADDAPQATALVVHGYSEHCGRYREVAGALTAIGLSALTFDLRGHGRSDGQRGYIQGIRDYLGDLRAAADELRRRNHSAFQSGAELPLFLVTHSNGGLVSLRYLCDPAQPPLGERGLVMSSPFLALEVPVRGIKKRFGRLAGRYAPTLSLNSDMPIEALTHDLDKLAARRADTLCHEAVTARWFAATERAQDYVAEHIARMTTPSLWLVAGSDRIANASVARDVHSKVRAPSRYREFPEMYHEVFNEVGRGEVFRMMQEFILEQLQ